MKGKAGDRDDRGADLGELDPLRDERFVITIGKLATEADRKKNGTIRVAPASVIKAAELAPDTSNRMTKTSAVLRKLSPKAAKNWHQNNGAKRRVAISDMDIYAPRYVLQCRPTRG